MSRSKQHVRFFLYTPAFNRITTLRTLDVSKNKIQNLGRLSQLKELKSFNCDENQVTITSLSPISKLSKLQSLSLGKNRLNNSTGTFPALPQKVKQLKVNGNALSTIPKQICASISLEKLDLSFNNIAAIPPEICKLVSLTELNLDNNVIVSLPKEIGQLKKLKALSLKNNHIQVTSTHFTESNPQPIPATLFTNTAIVDLNLGGNPLTSTQINEFDGFSVFLERRKKVKDKNIHGGALLNTSVCGLK